MSDKIKVGLFSITGEQTGDADFDSEAQADEFCRNYGQINSGFAKKIDKRIEVMQRAEKVLAETVRINEMMQKPEVTPQDKGEPSPVPYTLMIQRPSPDIDPVGREIYKSNLALITLDDCEQRIPRECWPFVKLARDAFRNGYYRFELVVGDWSIKVYKHPNNP